MIPVAFYALCATAQFIAAACTEGQLRTTHLCFGLYIAIDVWRAWEQS